MLVLITIPPQRVSNERVSGIGIKMGLPIVFGDSRVAAPHDHTKPTFIENLSDTS